MGESQCSSGRWIVKLDHEAYKPNGEIMRKVAIEGEYLERQSWEGRRIVLRKNCDLISEYLDQKYGKKLTTYKNKGRQLTINKDYGLTIKTFDDYGSHSEIFTLWKSDVHLVSEDEQDRYLASLIKAADE